MKTKLISELEIGDVITSTSPFWSHDWIVVASPVEGFVATTPVGNPDYGVHLIYINDASVLVREL